MHGLLTDAVLEEIFEMRIRYRHWGSRRVEFGYHEKREALTGATGSEQTRDTMANISNKNIMRLIIHVFASRSSTVSTLFAARLHRYLCSRRAACHADKLFLV